MNKQDLTELLKAGKIDEFNKFGEENPGTEIDLSELIGGAGLNGADLTNAFLLGACLNGALLCYADLEGANLRGADLRGDLECANFKMLIAQMLILALQIFILITERAKCLFLWCKFRRCNL